MSMKVEKESMEKEKNRIDAEKKLLQAERAAISKNIEAESSRLKEASKQRKAEEARFAEIRKKCKDLEAAAALAFAAASAAKAADDTSKQNDDSPKEEIKSVHEKAMTRVAALGQRVGKVVFEQLLDSTTEQLGKQDALDFRRKLASGELFNASGAYSYTFDAEEYPQQGGKPHYKPSGWVCCGLRNRDEARYRDWCVAYHGTRDCNALRILLHGLQRPGDVGVTVQHGQHHSLSGKSIYVSPSIEYAAFPCYAALFQVGEEHWAQLVLECRVRPGAFSEASGTLGSNKHWPSDVDIDPNFSGIGGLEWLLENPDDVVVTGLMIRELGRGADPEVYGTLVTQVRGPEYLWTEVRAQRARESQSCR